MMRASCFVAFLVLGTPASAWASVRVVSPVGPYADIQSAIGAAGEGDTILVKPGTYPGFVVQGKSLTISADPAGSVMLTSHSIVSGIGPTQRLVLTGFLFPAEDEGGIQMMACSGAVRLEDLATVTIRSPAPGGAHAIHLNSCAHVAILRCNLAGADASVAWLGEGPGHGLLIHDGSKVAVYDSHLRGGHGRNASLLGPGGSLIPVSSAGSGCGVGAHCTLFVSGTTFQGGDGGDGLAGMCSPSQAPGQTGGGGGRGLEVNLLSQAFVLDSTATGGAGGSGGAAAPGCGQPAGQTGFPGEAYLGAIVHLAPSSRHVACATLVRELAPLSVSITGQPGDRVWLGINTRTAWALDLGFHGVRLVGPMGRSMRRFLGTLPGSGTLTTTLVFPDMGPGVQARTHYLQALFRDPAGQSVWGTAEVFTLLDSAF